MTDPAQRRASDELPTGPAAPRERGWWKLVVATLAFLLVPATQARTLLPIEHTLLLLVVAMAACALAGWWAGGRAPLALAWVALAVFMLANPAGDGPVAYDRLARGWALLLGASFGLVLVFGRGRAFFGRGLAALGIALVVGLLTMTTGSTTPAELRHAVESELNARAAETMAATRAPEVSGLRTAIDGLSASGSLDADNERLMRAFASTGAATFGAMLGLESLLALALAWALYHRVSRARLGPPLARVREFRFSDQLVWGLIVGLVLVLLPSLASLRPLGFDLLAFFGALYALRGFGVLVWFLQPERLGMIVLLTIAFIFLPFVGALSLGLGLGDTWADWRARGPRPTP